jgi:hypothetical protein
MIPLKECRNGFLYEISSLNLLFGVFRSRDSGFIGIREKFGRFYLDTEHHAEIGSPYGSVHPLRELEPMPEGMSLEETLGSTVDWHTNRPIAFDKPVWEGGKGWYYIDTGLSSEGICPIERSNDALFYWLKAKKEKYYRSLR